MKEDRIRFVARKYKEGSLNTEAAWETFAARHGIRRRTILRRYIWGAAAILLLLIGLSGRYWMEKNASEWIAITTGTGEYKEVWLPDSTMVSLAGNTSIRYDIKQYGKERRAVEMSGKAFFQVTRDEARPFSVLTQQTIVEVLGTGFQLEEKDLAVILNVQTGKVRFSAIEDSQTAILTAGMSASYSGKGNLQVDEKETDVNFLSWKTRQLRFRNTPLDQVLRDISETYQVEIINHTKKDSELQLTSYFDNLPLSEIISVINQTLDIQLEVRPIH